jgi:16S rRNA G966 N2-methylase RsmD
MNRYLKNAFSQVNRVLSGTLYVGSTTSEISPWYALEGKIRALKKLSGIAQTSAMITTLSTASIKNTMTANTLDYIFTDPPFGSNIIYSDLSIIWESWLQAGTNTQAEAVVHRRKQHQAHQIDDYSGMMIAAFRSMYYILKPNRWITVEFHNTQNAIWNVIQEAISRVGFVIADVRTLDKQQSSFKQVTASGAVKADLVISAYKPRTSFEQAFERVRGSEDGAWSFVREHLAYVPIFVESKGKAEVIAERLPYLLFDRMVAFHLQRGASVPLSAAEFYAGLRSRFPERDGMHFLETQAAEYDARRAAVGSVEQFTFYVSDEKSSIQWLRQLLAGGPLTYQDIQPKFLQELQQSRNELLPELRLILQANFLQDDQGRWYVPDATKQVDLEKLRKRELLREYATYTQGRGKLKSVRSEAVRAGFEEAYRSQDYAGILAVATRLPEAVLREDSAILTYYDLAQMEMEG